jgi:hypothetical protein
MSLSARISTSIIAVYPPVPWPSFPYGEVALCVWFIYRENKNAYSASLLLFAAFSGAGESAKLSVEGMIRCICNARLMQSRSMEYLCCTCRSFL